MTAEEVFAELDRLRRGIDAVAAAYRNNAGNHGKDLEKVIHQSCTSKKRYSTPEAAGKGAVSAKAQGSTDELRIYACAFCGQYHLTKTPLAMLGAR